MALMVIISRGAAREAGLTHFFTAMPCKHGHVAKRFVRSGDCFECSTIRRLACDNATKSARVKRSRLAKRDEYNAAARAWYANNREKRIADTQRWQKRNPDKVAHLKIRLTEKNADRIKQQGTKWRLANPEKVRTTHARRAARKASAPGTFTHQHLSDKLGAQKFRCAAPHCGTDVTGNYSVDHMVPLSRGGSNWPGNIQILCPKCNSAKRDRTMEEWLASPITRARYGPKEEARI